jgi:hypothetical protein
MASTNQSPQQGPNNLDRYVVVHVATTCDEHGVYVTKDSAEVIELGWILLDAKTCEEARYPLSSHYHFRLTIPTAPSRIRPCQTRQYPNHSAMQ